MPPHVLNEVVAKGAFLSKVCPPNYVLVHFKQEAPKSSTEQEEGSTDTLLLLHSKHMKREALQDHYMRT